MRVCLLAFICFFSTQAFSQIDFQHQLSAGFSGSFNNAGVSFNDYDNDGYEDIYTVYATGNGTSTSGAQLYKNNGDGTFSMISNATPLPSNAVIYTGIFGDYDNDSDLDIYVGGDFISYLFRNDGNGTFTDVSTVSGTASFSYRTLSAAWLDYDQDGFIDLFLATFSSTTHRLLKNMGNGTFSDYTTQTNIDQIPPGGTNARGLATGDYDRDGDIDIFVTNIGTLPNHFFRNDGGTFVEIAASLGLSLSSDDNHSAVFVDYDNDGDLDLFLGNGGAPLRLFRNNNGGATFTDVSTSAGLTGNFNSNSCAFADIDNDGDLDLLNAGVELSTTTPKILMRNNGDGTFTEVPSHYGLIPGWGIYPGIAVADYDNDGKLDYYGASASALADTLYHNETSNSNHWIELKLVGNQSNKSAIGATVDMFSNANERQLRQIAGNGGFYSQSSFIMHFGLGSSLSVDSLIIKWPSGITQHITNLAADQKLTITESAEPPIPVPVSISSVSIALTNSSLSENDSVEISASVVGTTPAVTLVFGKGSLRQGAQRSMDLQQGQYRANIPSSEITKEGTWFRIKAENSLNSVYYPSEAGRVNLNIQIHDLSTTAANSAYPEGIPPDDFYIVSLPANHHLPLDSIFGPQKTNKKGEPLNWAAYKYDGQFKPVNELSNTDGVIIFHRDKFNQHLNIDTSTTVDLDYFDNIVLHPGWNLVPWPYAFRTDFTIKDNSKIGVVWTRVAGGWEQADTLKPFSGYAVYNKTNSDLIIKDALDWPGTLSKSTHKVDDDLLLQLSAFTRKYKDVDNYFGTGSSSSDGFDDLDEVEPLDIGNGLSMYFNHTSKLSSDFRSNKETLHEWDLLLNNRTSDSDVELNWKPLAQANGQKLALVDITHNMFVDMNIQTQYSFRSTEETTKFRIFAGNTSDVDQALEDLGSRLPKAFALLQNYPNPFNPTTKIPFDLARSGPMSLKIYNLIGQEVRTVVSGHFDTGKYTVDWDGKDRAGHSVASGVYIYRLESPGFRMSKKLLFIK